MNTQIAETPDARHCKCYALKATDGTIRPVFCMGHAQVDREARAKLYSQPKYERYFDTEQDAMDRHRIIHDRWPGEGYGTTVHISPVSRWYLVQAWWADSCE
jgi:hypothetical protein